MTQYIICCFMIGRPDCRIHKDTGRHYRNRKPNALKMRWRSPHSSLQAAENAMFANGDDGNTCGICHPER